MERKESIDWKFIGKIAFIAGTTVVGTIVAVVSAGMISAPVVGTALSVV